MELGANPFEYPLMAIGIVAGVIAALIPSRMKNFKLARMIVLLVGTLACWGLLILKVDWAYTHPFNPNDGAARVFSLLFGGVMTLIWPILPSFGVMLLLKKLWHRE